MAANCVNWCYRRRESASSSTRRAQSELDHWPSTAKIPLPLTRILLVYAISSTMDPLAVRGRHGNMTRVPTFCFGNLVLPELRRTFLLPDSIWHVIPDCSMAVLGHLSYQILHLELLNSNMGLMWEPRDGMELSLRDERHIIGIHSG